MHTISLTDKPLRPRAHISLTPLIDVVFILLLFFMLSSTFSPLSALNIHSVSHGTSHETQDKKPVFIHVIDEQQWMIDGTTYHTLDEKLRVLLKQTQQENVPVLVRSGVDAKVQDIVTALAYLQDHGIDQLNWGNSVELHDAR